MTSEKTEFWLDIAYHLHIDARRQDELTMEEWDQAVAAVKHIREEAKKADR